MDRFIEIVQSNSEKESTDLKSNMDRFIVTKTERGIDVSGI